MDAQPSGSQPEVSEAIAHDDNCLQEFLVTAKAVVPKLGVNYPPGVICDSSGVTRNENHNVVLYYERSLRNIEGNKT